MGKQDIQGHTWYTIILDQTRVNSNSKSLLCLTPLEGISLFTVYKVIITAKGIQEYYGVPILFVNYLFAYKSEASLDDHNLSKVVNKTPAEW